MRALHLKLRGERGCLTDWGRKAKVKDHHWISTANVGLNTQSQPQDLSGYVTFWNVRSLVSFFFNMSKIPMRHQRYVSERLWSELTYWRRGEILTSSDSTGVTACRIKVIWIRIRCLSPNVLSILIPDVGRMMRQMTAAVTRQLWPRVRIFPYEHLQIWIFKERKDINSS